MTRYQAHKGATHGRNHSARRRGLLAAGLIVDGHKEILSLKKKTLSLFDLRQDGKEQKDLADQTDRLPSQELTAWLEEIQRGLDLADEVSPQDLDEESIEQLRALGYIE